MFDFLLTALTFIVPFMLVLGLVVTIHELGHFLAAKSFGVAVDRFSIGFGKAMAAWTDKSGVEWRIGWIPLGGYVRFAGDGFMLRFVVDPRVLRTMELACLDDVLHVESAPGTSATEREGS